MHFKDIPNGITTADTGIIFKTTNGGNEWVKTFNNNTYRIGSISFANNLEGNAFGSNGKILRTTDYGSNWSVSVSPTNRNLGVSKFVNSQTGFVLGNGAVVLKSTNSGGNWNLLQIPLSDSFNCVDMNFINANTGWILSQRTWGYGYPINIYYYNVKIIKTTDNGTIWSNVYDSTSVNNTNNFYNSIKFFDNLNGWTMTSNKIMKTSNGGINWFTHNSNLNFNINKLVMLNQNKGWAGGTNYVNGNNWGAVYKTTNAGLNWFLQFNEYNKPVRSMYFIDSLRGWFCGDKSSVYSTTNGGGSLIGILPTSNQIPSGFSLHQNYPNPFNPISKIKFDIPKMSGVKVIIYDLLGREVATLVNEQLKPGTYETEFDGSNFASGIYFYSLITDEYTETRKMVLIK